jgi:hypothetical protein
MKNLINKIVDKILGFIGAAIVVFFILIGIAVGIFIFGWAVIWIVGLVTAIFVGVGIIYLLAKLFK